MTIVTKSVTKTVIRGQFPFRNDALQQAVPKLTADTIVLTGCGSSYFLAQSLACAYNSVGQRAIAVPSAEWAHRANNYLPDTANTLVIALSRSGTTSETLQAVSASRAIGVPTFAISCEEHSTILTSADQSLYLPTHPAEGIVMSASASPMFLGGLRLLGIPVSDRVIAAGEAGLQQMDAGELPPENRTLTEATI